MTAESDGAALAVLFIADKEIADIAGDRSVPNRGGVIKNISHDVRGIRLAADKARTGKKITVCGTSHNAFGHMTTC